MRDFTKFDFMVDADREQRREAGARFFARTPCLGPLLFQQENFSIRP